MPRILASLLCGVAGVLVGTYVASMVDLAFTRSTIAPFDVTSAQSVVEHLKPLGCGFSATDVSVFLFGDGQVHVDVKICGGGTAEGHGPDLRSAVVALISNSRKVGDALGDKR